MTRTIRVILNPVSGNGAARRGRDEIERQLRAHGVEFALELTEAPGHAVELARTAAADGFSAVAAVGGDGTIHEVVNGLLDSSPGPDGHAPPLGVVPAGSGNDFFKLVGAAGDRRRAFEILARGRVRLFDVGRVTWDGDSTGPRQEYFVNGMGTGVDVDVVRQMQRIPRRPGVVAYLVGLLRGVVRFRAPLLRIRLDAETIEQKVMIIGVGNGCCQGGGFFMWPDAEPDDGLLDVCIVGEMSRLRIARVIPRVLRGTHANLPEVRMARVRSVEIESLAGGPLFFQLDGELREPAAAKRLRIEVLRHRLPVLVAPGPER